jgi:exopolyphosphatase/guanosine-5'-triphosphate,3'-diphosphate pyrophosphatase
LGPTPSRFEFRVWGEDLSAAGAQLRALSRPGPTRTTDELYLAAVTTAIVNVKVRSDLLDIKTLDLIVDGLEQWHPIEKLEFPVAAGWVQTRLFPLWRLEPPELARSTYTLNMLIDEVVALEPQLAAVAVHKQRHALSLNGCIAEFAEVTIAQRKLQTVALESADPQQLRDSVELAGLGAATNTSYPRAIHSVLGWSEA